MKLFKYQMGTDEKLGVAENEKDAYERRTEVDHTFRFLPVTITEVTLEGYEITLTPTKQEKQEEVVAGPFDDLDVDGLKALLDEKEIKYHWNSGEDKLRELALNHV
jgi:hypothetical protein